MEIEVIDTERWVTVVVILENRAPQFILGGAPARVHAIFRPLIFLLMNTDCSI